MRRGSVANGLKLVESFKAETLEAHAEVGDINKARRKRKKRSQDFLDKLKTKKKVRHFCTFDLESKRGDSRIVPGFTRPFLAGFFDPEALEYDEFRDEPHLRERPWEQRFTDPGGCVDKLMQKCLQSKYSGWSFYAHNGGNFDMLFLLHWVEARPEEYGMEVVPIQSTIQIMRVWRIPEDPEEDPSESWEFLDSARLIPDTLAGMCETFLKQDQTGKLGMNLSKDEDDPEWSVYLKQDCVALAMVMNRVTDMVADMGGEVGITTPSTSVKLFRREFMGKDGCPERIARYQHWPECDDKARCDGCFHNWIRSGYCGGRTEIHTFAGVRLYYFDFNSSYAASMFEDMPIGTRSVEKNARFIDWRRHYQRGGKYGGFAECTVYIPEDCDIPPLPYRDPTTGKLTFPCGFLTGVWSLDELLLLEDKYVGGRVVEVKRVVWFRMLPMFQGMIETLFRYRDKSLKTYDKGLDKLAKLLINGGYGKFAMKRERTSLVFAKAVPPEKCYLCGQPNLTPHGLCAEHQGSKSATPHDPDGDVYYQAQNCDAEYIIPQISAHITATARVRIWKAMRIVKELGGRIYYLDTDSVITDVQLPTSHVLGALKDEYPGEWLKFEAVQPKVYMVEKMRRNNQAAAYQELLDMALDGKEVDASTIDTTDWTFAAEMEERKKQNKIWGRKAKEDPYPWSPEVPLKHESKITMKGFPRDQRTRENFEKLKEGQVIKWEQLEKVRTLAAKRFQRGPQMRAVEKSFKSKYDKRNVNPDGNTTSPHWVDDRTPEQIERMDQEAAAAAE